MSLSGRRRRSGFTLPEFMVAMAVGSVMLGGLMVTSTSLQRWFASADFVISCQQDQATVLDYIARDVRRAASASLANGDRRLDLLVPDQTNRAADNSLKAPALNGTKVQYGTTPGTVSYYLQGNSLVREDSSGVIALSTNVDEIHTDLSQPPVVKVQLIFKPAPRRTAGVTAIGRFNLRNLAGHVQ